MMTTTTIITPKRIAATDKNKGNDVDYTILPKIWFDDGGDIFMTHFLNALSITFPEGERYFMTSVRQAIKHNPSLKKAVDKNHSLRKDIKAFISQESLHGYEHDRLNNFLKDHGYPVDEATSLVGKLLKSSLRKEELRSFNLATTCALEHITAILADMILTDEQLTNKMHSAIRPLWIWHAQEEDEHKAVAFDVYNLSATDDVDSHYYERTAAMIVATIFLFVGIHGIQAAFIAKDGKLLNVRMWVDGFNKLYGAPKGHKPYIKRLVPAYMKYFKKGFHPNQDVKLTDFVDRD